MSDDADDARYAEQQRAQRHRDRVALGIERPTREFGPPPGATAAPKANDLVNCINRMVAFDYVNHRGEDGRRCVTFTSLHFGTVEGYYPTPTFLFCGWDHDKRAVRSFDFAKMRNVEVL